MENSEHTQLFLFVSSREWRKCSSYTTKRPPLKPVEINPKNRPRFCKIKKFVHNFDEPILRPVYLLEIE